MIVMQDVALSKQRVMIREDFNVPIRDGIITSDKRIVAALPTIRYALDQGAAVMLLSHLGRPVEGQSDEKFSLSPVRTYLEEALGIPVRLVKDYLDGINIQPGELVLCENVRFNVGECDNDPQLSQKLAALCDVFVMDAFGTAHRAHASTTGIAKYTATAAAGPLLVNELQHLSRALKSPEHPIVAVVGGAKVSTKLMLLSQLADMVDTLILGGGIANTFLKAAGHNIGASLAEHDLVDEAKAMLDKAPEKILLPSTVVVSKSWSEASPAYNKKLQDVAQSDYILDIGSETVTHYSSIIACAKTVIWNGPVGAFEFAPFSYGSRDLAFAIAQSNAYSIAGGGDTLAVIDKFKLDKQISYISTGGGAFLEYIEGKTLPAVDILERRAQGEEASSEQK